MNVFYMQENGVYCTIANKFLFSPFAPSFKYLNFAMEFRSYLNLLLKKGLRINIDLAKSSVHCWMSRRELQDKENALLFSSFFCSKSENVQSLDYFAFCFSMCTDSGGGSTWNIREIYLYTDILLKQNKNAKKAHTHNAKKSLRNIWIH